MQVNWRSGRVIRAGPQVGDHFRTSVNLVVAIPTPRKNKKLKKLFVLYINLLLVKAYSEGVEADLGTSMWRSEREVR